MLPAIGSVLKRIGNAGSTAGVLRIPRPSSQSLKSTLEISERSAIFHIESLDGERFVFHSFPSTVNNTLP